MTYTNQLAYCGVVDLDGDEIDAVAGGDYWDGAGAFAAGAGTAIRGGLIIAGVATSPGWVGAAMVVAGTITAGYGIYRMWNSD